jgi:glutathione S-transferase
MKPILYVFPISHFSEKARWALDRANFSYELKLLTPGEHIPLLKGIASETSLPVLQMADQTIQGSSKIIDHIDEQAFGAITTPEELEMESKIDEQIGKGLQTMLYHFILGYPEIIGKLFSLTPPKKEENVPPPEKFDFIALVLKKKYKINPKNVEVVMTNVQNITTELQEIYKKQKFFNGKSFGRVDLTIASLMGVLVFPKEAPASAWFASVTMPEPFLAWRESLHAQFLFDRLGEFYKEFRTQSK